MGHFGRAPDHPGLAAAGLPGLHPQLHGPGRADPRRTRTARSASPFFLLVPHWGRVPMVLLATAATVIASQAVITGAFSVTHQAVQLGYLPRLRIPHTSEQTIGQIYVPWINWVLMVSVLTLVFAFQTSTALAFAFGMAVTGTITITTLLFFYIVRHQWGKPLWLVLGRRRRLPGRRPPVPRREPDQDHPRRVASAADRRDRVHGAHHLAARPRAGHRAARARRGVAARRSSTSCTRDSPRCSAFPARPSSSTAARARRPRSRCAPTSSTTRSCTSTS